MEPECQYIENYKLHGLWGDGGQANVYLGSKGKDLYAIKVYFPGPSKEEAFKREVEFLAQLNFKNLINMVEAKVDGKVKLNGKDEQTKPIIVLEFAEGGELFEFISKEGKFKPEICRSVFRQLIAAIEYMDGKGVAHRDLKPENILFDKNFILRVSDFGLSTLSEGHDGDGMLYTRLGTQGYKPPEMELGKYTGIQADLFAAGVILFIIYTGTPPFLSTKNTDKIYKLIRDKNFAKFWALHEKKKPKGFYPDSLKRLLNSFFSAEVEKRPNIESLKDDEWLNQDQAMQDEIFQELKAKYERMAEGDEKKMKLLQIKKELHEKEVMEQEQNCDMQGSRTGESEFMIYYKESIDLETDKLAISQKKNITWVSKNISFVLAWINNYLAQAKKEKNVFMEESCFEITPEEYKMTFDEKTNEMNLKFFFNIDEEEVEELNVSGKMFKSEDNKIGVEWNKESGNTFWLSSIIRNLNDQMKVLV